ncbi:D-alanyl-D-alanine carboxypeptidase family protein [Clostridium weizhouense]|uniref:serine-type D-Ala-D-Ala carboxypeptidase n=1 Tax=Clostridium weizhouense TaxID=2859781 RepID=A0ABS7AJF5_9CLOT|nr:D-alanyl-D-alanine carboxypeptidase family protein [Clostridium weizhouense]MBW6408804.1 D-alanyl-D-alanine carboxypeptidase [Clostridium weizhouense]
MKYILKVLNILILSLFLFPAINSYALATPPEINAEGCTLMDASTGKILYSKNSDKLLEPASTTKVMTALITLENCSLDEEVTVQEDFTKVDGTTIGLLKGDIVTIKDLLLGLLLESGNDAANALACHVSSSIEDFSVLMNKKAKELGALNTHFKNPSGLPDPEHLTTSKDLSLIMREAIKNKELLNICNVKCYEIKIKNDSSRTIWVNNKNHMINPMSKYYYPYTIAGKNGYTTKANHTYTISAEKNGHIIVASFLNALDKNKNFEDMKDILNYGFDNFDFINLYKEGQQIDSYKINEELTVPLIATKDIDYVVPKDENKNATPHIDIEEKNLSKTSFNKGDVILKGNVYLNNEKLCSVDLASAISRQYDIKDDIKHFFNKYKTNLIVGGSVLGISLLGISTYLIERKKKKKRKKKLLEITSSLPKINDNFNKRINK